MNHCAESGLLHTTRTWRTHAAPGSKPSQGTHTLSPSLPPPLPLSHSPPLPSTFYSSEFIIIHTTDPLPYLTSWTHNSESIGDDFAEGLKDGQILCKVVNAIEPGKIKKIAASSMAFRQMENIAKFLEAAADLGVAGPSLFQTVALYEQKDMLAVLICIQALSRAATEGGYTGPAIDINRPEAI